MYNINDSTIMLGIHTYIFIFIRLSSYIYIKIYNSIIKYFFIVIHIFKKMFLKFLFDKEQIVIWIYIFS